MDMSDWRSLHLKLVKDESARGQTVKAWHLLVVQCLLGQDVCYQGSIAADLAESEAADAMQASETKAIDPHYAGNAPRDTQPQEPDHNATSPKQATAMIDMSYITSESCDVWHHSASSQLELHSSQ